MPRPRRVRDRERPRDSARPRRPGLLTRARNRLADLLERGGNNLLGRARRNRGQS